MSLVTYFSQRLRPKIKKQLELACKDIELMGQRVQALEKKNADQLAQLIQSENSINAAALREAELSLKIEILENQKLELAKRHDFQLCAIQTESELVSKKLFDIEKEHGTVLSKLEMDSLEMGILKGFLTESENEIKELLIRYNTLLSDLDHSKISLENMRTELAQLMHEKQELDLELRDSKLSLKNLNSDLAIMNSEKEASELQHRQGNYDFRKKIALKDQENQLLIHQMHQLQETVEDLLQDRQRSTVEIASYKKRWRRLGYVLPEYIQYDQVEITAVDDTKYGSRISWRVLGCEQIDIEIRDLQFYTFTKAGTPGVILEIESDDGSKIRHINPKQLLESPRCKEELLKLGLDDFRVMCSAILVLDWIISHRWQGVQMVDRFDPNFWQSSLLELTKHFKRLPKLFRWDAVSLLQEVRHIDYENLWIELIGVQFGLQYIPKIELRIGAALMDPVNFSRHPKFEFPLIEGEKPFSGWYEESSDDLGPKFELRYSLDEKAVDIGVLRKLALNDRELVISIINSTPKFLADLMNQGISINRPWIVWMDFTTQVCKLNSLILGKNRDV